MVTHTFLYKDMIALGFKREDIHDQQFIDQYGYDWFVLNLKLAKNFYLNWDPTERTVELIRWRKSDGSILGRLPLFSMDEIKEMIEFFKKK